MKRQFLIASLSLLGSAVHAVAPPAGPQHLSAPAVAEQPVKHESRSSDSPLNKQGLSAQSMRRNDARFEGSSKSRTEQRATQSR